MQFSSSDSVNNSKPGCVASLADCYYGSYYWQWQLLSLSGELIEVVVLIVGGRSISYFFIQCRQCFLHRRKFRIFSSIFLRRNSLDGMSLCATRSAREHIIIFYNINITLITPSLYPFSFFVWHRAAPCMVAPRSLSIDKCRWTQWKLLERWTLTTRC